MRDSGGPGTKGGLGLVVKREKLPRNSGMDRREGNRIPFSGSLSTLLSMESRSDGDESLGHRGGMSKQDYGELNPSIHPSTNQKVPL